MLTPRDRAHAVDRRGLQFLAAGVPTVAGRRTWPENHIPLNRPEVLSKWTWAGWMYVAVTGVVVYSMLHVIRW